MIDDEHKIQVIINENKAKINDMIDKIQYLTTQEKQIDIRILGKSKEDNEKVGKTIEKNTFYMRNNYEKRRNYDKERKEINNKSISIDRLVYNEELITMDKSMENERLFQMSNRLEKMMREISKSSGDYKKEKEMDNKNEDEILKKYTNSSICIINEKNSLHINNNTDQLRKPERKLMSICNKIFKNKKNRDENNNTKTSITTMRIGMRRKNEEVNPKLSIRNYLNKYNIYLKKNKNDKKEESKKENSQRKDLSISKHNQSNQSNENLKENEKIDVKTLSEHLEIKENQEKACKPKTEIMSKSMNKIGVVDYSDKIRENNYNSRSKSKTKMKKKDKKYKIFQHGIYNNKSDKVYFYNSISSEWRIREKKEKRNKSRQSNELRKSFMRK